MSRVAPFPEASYRAFLDLFDVHDRSTAANVFYFAVRQGARTVDEVLATMAAEVNRCARSYYGSADEAWVRRRTVIFDPKNREAARRFAQYALDREAGRAPKVTHEPELDSHLEDYFLHAWTRWCEENKTILADELLRLEPAHKVGVYTIDFALVRLRVAVELDGHDYHKTREQRRHGARKGRFLTMCGWLVFRFTGDEVHADPPGCCAELHRLAVRRGAFEIAYEPMAKERRG